jgi:hypothetical protein
MRCLREGRCVFNKGNSILNVMVRNLSSTGAKLTGDELLCLPDEFELQISMSPEPPASRWVKRVWGRGDAIGVAFVDAPESQSPEPGPLRPNRAA